MAITELLVTKIYVVDSITSSLPPAVKDRIVYEKATKKLKIYNTTSKAWEAIAATNTAIEGKADKATTLAGYNIGDAYTKTEVNTELGKKQNKLEGYTETLPETGGVETIKIATNTGDDSITLQGTKIVVNGKVSGTAISTSIPTSESAVDTKLPSEKAVATAIESVKEVASKAYKYKGSDTYANIIAKESPAVGDVWNSTTANGVYPKGTNYAWNGTEWDALGGEVDLSAYQKASDDTLSTTSKTVVGAINEVKGVADAAAKADASNITVATWKEKLGFITAEEQVQPDWNATSGKGQILNKPNVTKGANSDSTVINNSKTIGDISTGGSGTVSTISLGTVTYCQAIITVFAIGANVSNAITRYIITGTLYNPVIEKEYLTSGAFDMINIEIIDNALTITDTIEDNAHSMQIHYELITH